MCPHLKARQERKSLGEVTQEETRTVVAKAMQGVNPSCQAALASVFVCENSAVRAFWPHRPSSCEWIRNALELCSNTAKWLVHTILYDSGAGL